MSRWATVLCLYLTLLGPVWCQQGPNAGVDLPNGKVIPAVETAPVAAQEIQPAAAQSLRSDREDEEGLSYLIQLAPPGPERLFRIASEKELFERIRQEARVIRFPLEFPVLSEVTPQTVPPLREHAVLTAVAEPYYVCYGRLWFEQPNFERGGWDLGVLTPGISAGTFYVDLLASPLRWLCDPWRCYECNTGQCLPGDPTPLVLDLGRVK